MSSSGSKVYGSALYSIYTSLKSIFLSERLQIHKSSNWEQKIKLISAHFLVSSEKNVLHQDEPLIV